MTYYADSSFLVSCYLPDANPSRAKAYLRGVGAPLVLNALQAVEVGNAFELGVFRGLFSAAHAASAHANLCQDLRRGRLVKTAVNWPLAFRVASALSKRQSPLTPPRRGRAHCPKPRARRVNHSSSKSSGTATGGAKG
jgi:hypothetical protein